MANLLPKKEQDSLKKDYSLRRLDVTLFLVCIILAISLVLIFPSYILSKVRATNASLDLETVKKATNAANPSDDLTRSLREAKEKAVSLGISQKTTSVYDLVHTFESKSSAIKIQDIAYVRGADDTTIVIRGRADDRESLTALQKQLNANPNFSRVDLPISNFAKDKNIDFSMNITVKK